MRAARVCGVAAAVASLLVQAGPSASAATSGEMTLPPAATEAPAHVISVQGTATGVTWVGLDRPYSGLRYTTYAGRKNVPSSLPNGVIVGGSLYDNGGNAEDMASGQVHQTGFSSSGFRRLIGIAGDNLWLEYDGADGDHNRVHLFRNGSETASFPNPPVDGGTGTDYEGVGSRAVDDQGAFMEVLGNQPQPPGNGLPTSLSYLDFATGTYTQLVKTQSSYPVAMDTSWTAWCDGTTLVWAPRSDITNQHRLALPACNGIALSADNIAVATVAATSGGGGRQVVLSGPVGGNLTATSTAGAVTNPMAGPNGNFAVQAGSTAVDAGVYQLSAGGASLGSAIVLWGPAQPRGVTAAAGRVVTLTASGANELRAVRVASDGTARYGGAKNFVVAGGLDWSASGGHVAHLLVGPKGASVVITDDGAPWRRYTVPTHPISATISGRWLLIRYYTAGAKADGGMVINLVTGKHSAVPYTDAIDGNRIAYVRSNGEIRTRNLSTGRERIIRRGGDWRQSAYTIAISGHWVFYDLRKPDGSAFDAAAVNLDTGAKVPVSTTVDNFSYSANEHLADGLLAWTAGGRVHYMRLTDRRDHVIGSIMPRLADPGVALTDEFIAWLAPDARVHLLPLAASAAASPPRAQAAIAPAAFVPAGTGSPLTLTVDVTRPLTSWTLKIHNRSGHTVRTITGSGPSGDIRARWNGRDSHGHRAPDGTYSWTVTGSGPAGKLHLGRSTTLTGHVRVEH